LGETFRGVSTAMMVPGGVDVRHVSPLRVKRPQAPRDEYGAGPSGYASSVFGAAEAALVRHAESLSRVHGIGMDKSLGSGGGGVARARVDEVVRKVFELREFVGAEASDEALCDVLLGANEVVATAAEHWFMREGTPDGGAGGRGRRKKEDEAGGRVLRRVQRAQWTRTRTFADPVEQAKYDLKGKAVMTLDHGRRRRGTRGSGSVLGTGSTDESQEVEGGSSSDSGWTSEEDNGAWEVPSTEAMARKRERRGGGIVFRSPAGVQQAGARSPLKRRPSERPPWSEDSDSGSSPTSSGVSGASFDAESLDAHEGTSASPAPMASGAGEKKKKKKNTYWKRFKRALTGLTGYRRKGPRVPGKDAQPRVDGAQGGQSSTDQGVHAAEGGDASVSSDDGSLPIGGLDDRI